jgi:hypothetical protein
MLHGSHAMIVLCIVPVDVACCAATQQPRHLRAVQAAMGDIGTTVLVAISWVLAGAVGTPSLRDLQACGAAEQVEAGCCVPWVKPSHHCHLLTWLCTSPSVHHLRGPVLVCALPRCNQPGCCSGAQCAPRATGHTQCPPASCSTPACAHHPHVRGHVRAVGAVEISPSHRDMMARSHLMPLVFHSHGSLLCVDVHGHSSPHLLMTTGHSTHQSIPFSPVGALVHSSPHGHKHPPSCAFPYGCRLPLAQATSTRAPT